MKDWLVKNEGSLIIAAVILFSALLAKWDTTSKACKQADDYRQERDELRQGVDNLSYIINGKPVKEINPIKNKKGVK